jgi:hypothetical protein
MRFLRFSAALLCLYSNLCFALDNSWEVDKREIETITKNLKQNEQCGAFWNVIWPHIKNGNQEARANLLFL